MVCRPKVDCQASSFYRNQILGNQSSFPQLLEVVNFKKGFFGFNFDQDLDARLKESTSREGVINNHELVVITPLDKFH